MRWYATQVTHGSRNSAANSARPSATTAMPNTGTATRMKMYCSDHMLASASQRAAAELVRGTRVSCRRADSARSEEHTSELQSRLHLVCRLLLEKKKKNSSCRRTS